MYYDMNLVFYYKKPRKESSHIFIPLFHWKKSILTMVIRGWSMRNIQNRYRHVYKVLFKSSSTFQITRFLVAPSVWKLYRLIVYLCLCCAKFLWHLNVEKLRYRTKNDSTFVVSVEKWASNKERTSSFVLNI